jgi:Transposase IS4
MPNLTVFDSTDKGTLRPDEEPLESTGDKFVPMNLPHFDWEIHLPEDVSPDDPITLFTMYYTPKIMDMIVKNTNNYARKSRNELAPRARAKEWYPTCRGELYLYFAIRIYMTLVVLNEISDYWDKTKIMPTHEITKWMARDRFQELHMRVRLAGMGVEGAYAKVSKAPLISFLFFVKF